MPEPRRERRDSWLARLERRLLPVMGPADVRPVGTPPGRSPDRTAGVAGQWQLRRDSTGRTYLVAEGPDDLAPSTPHRDGVRGER